MKLRYVVLWCDDQHVNVASTRKLLAEMVQSELGFSLDVRELSGMPTPKELAAIRDSEEIDLMLVDLQLGPDLPTGDIVAAQLRAILPYTDIVFYSAESPAELRKLIAEKGLDGVYCVNRNDLEYEVGERITYDVKRRLDANQMRGLVMAEVADLDKLIESALLAAQRCLPEEGRKKVADYAIERIVRRGEKASSNCNELPAHELGPVAALVEQKLIRESQLRFDTLKESMKELQRFDANFPRADYRAKLKRYQTEVIDNRNILAHQPHSVEGRSLVFLDGDSRRTYTEDELIDVRRCLLGYSTVLTDLVERLNGQSA